jgi:Mn-dependent DtxR family transcriptional regulator
MYLLECLDRASSETISALKAIHNYELNEGHMDDLCNLQKISRMVDIGSGIIKQFVTPLEVMGLVDYGTHRNARDYRLTDLGREVISFLEEK